MKAQFDDIIKRAGTPAWYDVDGIPRYGEFNPDDVANIYANHIAFIHVGCQNCYETFYVTNHCHKGIAEADRRIIGLDNPEISLPSKGDIGWFRYGDPPRHNCIGDTMNSIPLEVLKFYIKEDGEYIRHPEYEVDVWPEWAKKVSYNE